MIYKEYNACQLKSTEKANKKKKNKSLPVEGDCWTANNRKKECLCVYVLKSTKLCVKQE